MNILIKCANEYNATNISNFSEINLVNEEINEEVKEEIDKKIDKDDEIEIAINCFDYMGTINKEISTNMDDYKKFLINYLNTLNKKVNINMRTSGQIFLNITNILNKFNQPNTIFHQKLFLNQITLKNLINNIINSNGINDISLVSKIDKNIIDPNYDLLLVLNNVNLQRMIVISKYSNEEIQTEKYRIKIVSFKN